MMFRRLSGRASRLGATFFLLVLHDVSAARPRHSMMAQAKGEHNAGSRAADDLSVIVTGPSASLQRFTPGVQRARRSRHTHHDQYAPSRLQSLSRSQGTSAADTAAHVIMPEALVGPGIRDNVVASTVAQERVQKTASVPETHRPLLELVNGTTKGLLDEAHPAGSHGGDVRGAGGPLQAGLCRLSFAVCRCNCTWRERWLPGCSSHDSITGIGCNEQLSKVHMLHSKQQEYPVFFLVVAVAPLMVMAGIAALGTASGIGKGYCTGDARKLGLSRRELEERISAATKLSNEQRQAVLDRFCGCADAMATVNAEAADEAFEPQSW